MVQSNHATLTMAQQFPIGSDIPSNVTIGVPDQAALCAVMERLVRYGIRFAAFYEPDFGMGLSAITTVPISKKEKYALSCYKKWEPIVGGVVQGQDAAQAEMSGTAPGLLHQVSFEGGVQ